MHGMLGNTGRRAVRSRRDGPSRRGRPRRSRAARPAAARRTAPAAALRSRGRERREVLTRGADPERERRPPLLERRDLHVHAERRRSLDLQARRRHQLGELTLARAGQVDRGRRARGELVGRPPEHVHRAAGRGPRRTRRPTPPGRTTRRISDRPRTGSAMNGTTSWAVARSKTRRRTAGPRPRPHARRRPGAAPAPLARSSATGRRPRRGRRRAARRAPP